MEARLRGSTTGAILGWSALWMIGALTSAGFILPIIEVTGTTGAEWWVFVVGLPIALVLLWGYGMFVIVRRRRKLLRDCASPPLAPPTSAA